VVNGARTPAFPYSPITIHMTIRLDADVDETEALPTGDPRMGA
jgi:hypothetical protein